MARSVTMVLRLRLLTPISGDCSAKRALQLGLVMHFEQHVHAERQRRVLQFGRLVVRQRRP